MRIEVIRRAREPFDGAGVLDFLAARAVPGVESVRDGAYARVLRLTHGFGTMTVRPGRAEIVGALELDDVRDEDEAVRDLDAVFDLGADPIAIADVLGADRLLAPMLASAPGLRVPGHVDGFELGVRAVLGQQVSVAGARTTAGRIVATYGTPVEAAVAAAYGLTHAFPPADVLADADPQSLGVPSQRGRAVTALAAAVASGSLDVGPAVERDELRAGLLALPGVGPWTADYVLMRATSDRDVFLDTDLIVRKELAELGAGTDRADRWRPWRSYAVMHLWRHASQRSTRPGARS